jgi:hypothetical protein
MGDAGPFVATMQTGQVWRQFVVVMTPLSCAVSWSRSLGW